MSLRKRRIIGPSFSYLSTPASLGVAYSAVGVHFDGSTDLYRGGVMTGEANSKSGMVSFWIKNGETPGPSRFFFAAWAGSLGAIVNLRIGNSVQLVVEDTTGATAVSITSASGAGSPGSTPPDDGLHNWGLGAPWRWFGASWDVAIGRMQCYTSAFNSTGAQDEFDGNSTTNNTLQYDTTTANFGKNYTIGSLGSLNGPFTGDLAELYMITGTSLDLSNSTNMRKFISATGSPVDLGTTGSAPTGTIPLLYFKGGASTFLTNQAGKGDLTVDDGTLTNSVTPLP